MNCGYARFINVIEPRASVNWSVPDSDAAICLLAHAIVAVMPGESPHFARANSSSFTAGWYNPAASSVRMVASVGGK